MSLVTELDRFTNKQGAYDVLRGAMNEVQGAKATAWDAHMHAKGIVSKSLSRFHSRTLLLT